MSDTLVGVMVGGIIASIVPIISLFQQYRQWKREKKLAYLLQERERLRAIYSNGFQKILVETTKGIYTPEFLSEIFFLLPEDIRREFMMFRNVAKNIPDNKRVEYLTTIADQMSKSLANIDKQINVILE